VLYTSKCGPIRWRTERAHIHWGRALRGPNAFLVRFTMTKAGARPLLHTCFATAALLLFAAAGSRAETLDQLYEKAKLDKALVFYRAGSVGETLGQAWLKHGEDVVWGLRNAADPKYAVLPRSGSNHRLKPLRELVVIATPWSATEAAVKSLGSLAGNRTGATSDGASWQFTSFNAG
jgi:hypothetical protein